MENINIPKDIKAKRAELRISQRELADLIGRTRCMVADWETGRSKVAAEIYLKIMALTSAPTAR
jgi:DNA-binding transcriptional regulator YiaG